MIGKLKKSYIDTVWCCCGGDVAVGRVSDDIGCCCYQSYEVVDVSSIY